MARGVGQGGETIAPPPGKEEGKGRERVQKPATRADRFTHETG